MILRHATDADIPAILAIIAQAREFLKNSGVDQWQGEYPGIADIRADIASRIGYVVEEDCAVIGTVAVTFDGEAAYGVIDGAWLTDGPYAAVHRIAVNVAYRGRGAAAFMLANIDEMCRSRGVSSVRSDTHRDNARMNGLLAKCGFTRCGIVQYPSGERVAYEKTLF